MHLPWLGMVCTTHLNAGLFMASALPHSNIFKPYGRMRQMMAHQVFLKYHPLYPQQMQKSSESPLLDFWIAGCCWYCSKPNTIKPTICGWFESHSLNCNIRDGLRHWVYLITMPVIIYQYASYSIIGSYILNHGSSNIVS
jgi:hypothetical protein